MADTRGTWSLSEAWAEKTASEWVNVDDVWLPAVPLSPDTADTAYWGLFGGGGDEVYKIPVPSDTWAKIPGSTSSINQGDATGSQTLGFTSGGYSYSWYKKVTYSTDTIATAHPGGGNAYRNYGNTAITDGDNGYWFGGERIPGSAALSSSEKVTYSTATVSAGSNLPGVRAGFIGSTGSTTTGYMCGGATPGRRSNMFKLVYSSSTMSTVPGADYPAPIASGDQSANGVTDTHGYFVGGWHPPGASSINCKLTYSSETFAREPGGNLPRSSYYLSTTGSRTVGYWGGGESPGSPNPIKNSNVHKLTYSNSTFANVPSSIQFNPNTWGEKARGFGPRKGGVPAYAPVQRWSDGNEQSGYGVEFDGSNDWLEAADSDDYSFGTGDYTIECWVNPEGTISDKGYVCKWKTSGNLEWFLGTNGTTLVFAYSTNGNSYTIPNSGYTMQSGVWQHIAVTRESGDIKIFVDGVQKGSTHDDSSADYHTGSDPLQIMANEHGDSSWRADGKISNVRIVKGQALYTSNFTSTTESLTDTSQGATASNVKIICCNSSTVTGSTKTSSTISVGGGTPDLITQTEVTPRPPAETPTASKSGLPTPSPNDGYYGGGSISGVGYYSKFDKISYASDTTSALPASDASYSGGVYAQSSTSSQTEGWSQAQNSNLYTFIYSTSTQSNSPSANLTFNPTGVCSGFGYIPKGYIVGGYSGGPIATMNEITFATSTVASAPDFAYAGYYKGSGTGNQTAGYLAGAVPGTTNAGKYVYATSTSTALPGKLSLARNESAGTGNSTNGYFSGNGTRTDRVVFSTDTFTYVPGANLLKAVDGVAANSSSTAGYLNGGSNPSNTQGTSDVDKLTYSNETMSSLPSSADTAQQRMSFMGFSARQYANGETMSVSTPNVI